MRLVSQHARTHRTPTLSGSIGTTTCVNQLWSGSIETDPAKCAAIQQSGVTCGCPFPTERLFPCSICPGGATPGFPADEDVFPGISLSDLEKRLSLIVSQVFQQVLTATGDQATAAGQAQAACTRLQNGVSPYAECPGYDVTADTQSCRLCGGTTPLPDFLQVAPFDSGPLRTTCGNIELLGNADPTQCATLQAAAGPACCDVTTLPQFACPICADGMPYERDPDEIVTYRASDGLPITCGWLEVEIRTQTRNILYTDETEDFCDRYQEAGEAMCGCRQSYDGPGVLDCTFCPAGSSVNPDTFQPDNFALFDGCPLKCNEFLFSKRETECPARQVAAVVDCGCSPLNKHDAKKLCESVTSLDDVGFESVRDCAKAVHSGSRGGKGKGKGRSG